MKRRNKLSTFIKIFELVMLFGIISFLMTNNVFSAAADPSYIYFDISAGQIEIAQSTYSGKIYETVTTNGVTETNIISVTGKHNANNKYYVYQSTSTNRASTGLVDGEMIIPEYDPIYVDGKLWKEYITNNTDIVGVIDSWQTHTSGKREATNNKLLISGYGSTYDVTIDNIWISYHARGSITEGSISISKAYNANTKVKLYLKGDNRLGSLRYYTKSNTTSSLTISSFYGDKSEEGSLTVIGSQELKYSNSNYTTVTGSQYNIMRNHWDSVIGGTDSEQDVKGLIFNGGTIYAGSTPRENSTAIGGGGNGFGNVIINGGNVTAVAHTTGTAIGGGIAHTSYGGTSDVVINDGKVYAYNFGQPAHDVIYYYGPNPSAALIEAARHIPGTAIGGASSIKESGNSSTALITINGGDVYAESLGGCAIGGGNSVNTTAGSAKVVINGGNVIANSKSQEGYTFSDGEIINIKSGVSIGGGTGGINGNGGYAEINITGGKLTAGSIGGGSTTDTDGRIGYAKITISGGETNGQFIMVKGANQACTFTMTGGKIYDSDTLNTEYQRLQENGGAVYMDDPNGVAKITGGSIENCKALNGGAVYMTAGTFTIEGTGKIENCEASNLGGAIYLGGTSTTKGTFYIKNGSISSNKTLTGNGGAIYLNGGDAYVSGGSIDNNNAILGGGVYLEGGSLNVTGGSINNNEATNGAGAYLAGGALNISGGSINENIATNGAGAYLTGGALNVTGGSINKNEASNDGGGAYLNGGVLNITGGMIDANNALNGAGAYVNSGTINMENGSFSSNIATNNGGGAYLAGGTLTLTGGNINNNKATNGAGAYLAGGTLDVSGGSINNNTASNDGGGAYLAGGILNITGGMIEENNASNGAGAYVNSGNINMKNGSFSSNIATNDGGGAYIAGGELNLTGGSFINNNASVNGGGALVSNGKLIVTAGLFENNSASGNGGGAYLAGGDFTLNGPNAIFNANFAKNGGGVYLTGGLPNLFDGLLTNNIASNSGGGIYIDKQHVRLAPTGSVKITGNKAGYNQDETKSSFDGYGGAIYIGGTLDKDDASFSVDTTSLGTVLIDKNQSKTYGGGVCIDNGYFTMDGENVQVTNNTALNGGGVSVMAGDFNISKGSIGEEGNANIADNGGGVYVSGGNVLIYQDGSIKNNTAHVDGGGVYVSNGNLTMIGGTVQNNTATGDGGGLYVSTENKDVIVEILSGAIRNNTSKGSGGALAVVGVVGGSDNITVTLGVNKDHTDINKCDHGKGDIHSYTCPVIEFNESSKSGGAIYITGGKSTKLNLYCLEEAQNSVSDVESRSHFMMVEGGTVVISTLENNQLGTPATYGHNTINNSIHVTAGAMDLYGSMSNPKIDAPITVDIKSEEDHYQDHRTADGTYYKLQYFENFKNTDGQVTGQYTVYQIPHGTYHTISGVIYNHPGYEIIGWFTNPNGSGDKYNVGSEYLFNGNPIGDLKIYAIWQIHSYYVEFDPNVPSGTSYSGTMESVQYNYNTSYILPENAFIRKGYIFKGWIDNKSRSYSDGAVVINLTAVDGEIIILYAQWEICEHDDSAKYIYTSSGNVITLECGCLGYSETATLVGESTVYDTHVHNAHVDYSGNKIPALTITYIKDEVVVSEPIINAGTYKISISINGVTAEAIHFIDKAEQIKPKKPTYTVNKDVNGLFNNIVVDDKEAPNGLKYEYLLEWYSGTTLENSTWGDIYSFQLEISHTNYYVYIRYAENENYYASAAVRADAVYYFDGYASIKVYCPEEIEFTLTNITDKSGIEIAVKAKSGYYLTNDFSVTSTEPSLIQTNVIRSKYLLYNIPSTGTVEVTISGVKLNPGINAYVTENEVFSDFKSTNAIISNDSAFTVVFNLISVINDYQNYAIKFNRNIPIGTSIIFVNDKTKEYKYINLESSINIVSINDMIDLFDDKDSVIENDEQFRFIVNFANTTNALDLGDLNVSIIAEKVNELDECVVTLPTSESTVNIVNINNSLSEYAAPFITNPLEKTLDYSFAKSDGDTSKWEGRNAVLHFTPLTNNLPEDARLKVVIGNETTTYHLTDNKFIVSLNKNIKEYIRITLESDMFESNRSEYIFKVEMIASNSLSSQASFNGDVLAKLDEVRFIKEETLEPSAIVMIDKTSYKVGETIKATINYKNINEDYVVSLTLMLRDDNFNYSSTGWTTNITTEGEIEVPLAGQNAGSYTLTCVVKDESGFTVLNVPCYFVVTN